MDFGKISFNYTLDLFDKVQVKALFFKKEALTLDRSLLKFALEMFTVYLVSPKKICKKFAQFELCRAPDSVIRIFSKWDKRILAVIINYREIA